MIRTQIQLTEEQAKAIKKMATARHQSMADLIRQAVDTLLKTNISLNPDEQKKRALSVAGRFSSGKGNISREHDAYLAEAIKK
jgi:hypothetical protein